MLAPVLTPLAATLAPPGATGRTLAALSGAQTLATAVGPGLSGLLLGLGLPVGFVALQLLCCLLAIAGARRLGHTDGCGCARGRPRRLTLARPAPQSIGFVLEMLGLGAANRSAPAQT